VRPHRRINRTEHFALCRIAGRLYDCRRSLHVCGAQASRLRCAPSLVLPRLRPPRHLSLRPALLQQPRQLPPRSGAHAATPAGLSCHFWRTAYSPGFSRVYGFKCRNSLVDAVALRTKFRKNPAGVHNGGYPNTLSLSCGPLCSPMRSSPSTCDAGHRQWCSLQGSFTNSRLCRHLIFRLEGSCKSVRSSLR